MTLFDNSHIIMDIHGKTKDDILNSIASKAISLGVSTSVEVLVDDFLRREGESSIAFGHHIAFPHSKNSNNSTAAIIFARAKERIQWSTMINDLSVNTWVAIIVPASEAKLHLQLLSSLSYFMEDENFAETLKEGSEEEVLTAINKVISHAKGDL